jgi:hypothetical protein
MDQMMILGCRCAGVPLGDETVDFGPCRLPHTAAIIEFLEGKADD